MRRTAGAALLVVAATTLSGCSLKSFGMGSTPRGSSSAEPGTSTSAATSTSPADTRNSGPRLVRGDLSEGTVTHTQQVGTSQLAITYWTTRDVGTWTAPTPATVHLSAKLRRAPGTAKVPVFVTGLTVTFGTDRSTRTLVLKRDSGRFVLTQPYSYATAVVVPGAPASATSAHLDVQLDLIVATTPKARDFARQTALDTLAFSYKDPS